MKKDTINELIKGMNLPDTTKFLGYSIHLQEEDEFLMEYEIKPGLLTNMWWTKQPETAKYFKSIKKVEKIKDKIKPEANVVCVFDTGPQIIVTQPKNQ